MGQQELTDASGGCAEEAASPESSSADAALAFGPGAGEAQPPHRCHPQFHPPQQQLPPGVSGASWAAKRPLTATPPPAAAPPVSGKNGFRPSNAESHSAAGHSASVKTAKTRGGGQRSGGVGLLGLKAACAVRPLARSLYRWSSRIFAAAVAVGILATTALDMHRTRPDIAFVAALGMQLLMLLLAQAALRVPRWRRQLRGYLHGRLLGFSHRLGDDSHGGGRRGALGHEDSHLFHLRRRAEFGDDFAPHCLSGAAGATGTFGGGGSLSWSCQPASSKWILKKAAPSAPWAPSFWRRLRLGCARRRRGKGGPSHAAREAAPATPASGGVSQTLFPLRPAASGLPVQLPDAAGAGAGQCEAGAAGGFVLAAAREDRLRLGNGSSSAEAGTSCVGWPETGGSAALGSATAAGGGLSQSGAAEEGPRRFASDDLGRVWLGGGFGDSRAAARRALRLGRLGRVGLAGTSSLRCWVGENARRGARGERAAATEAVSAAGTPLGGESTPCVVVRYSSEVEALRVHQSLRRIVSQETVEDSLLKRGGLEWRLRLLLLQLEGDLHANTGSLLELAAEEEEDKEKHVYKARRVVGLLLQVVVTACRAWLVPLLHSPASLLALLSRTLAWCGVWLWATTYMQRSPGEKGLLTWNFSGLPDAYSFVEAVFVWMVTADYCVGLLLAEAPLAFVLSPYSLIDLATLPIAGYFIRTVFTDPRAHSCPWLLVLGWLRFLRLVRTERVLSACFPTLSVVTLRVVSIGVSWLMFVLTFAGGIFVLEAPDEAHNYTNVYDLCFYAVVTVMTVGYGDFTPLTAAGRGLAMCVIVSAFAYLPGEIQRLMEALREPRTLYGTLPASDEDYLCLVGPIQPAQFSAFCVEVGRGFPGSATCLMLITPLPVAAYVDACQAAIKACGVRVCIRGGARGSLLPSAIRPACSEARAVFVFSNSRPYPAGFKAAAAPSKGRGGSADGAAIAAGSGESVETREQEEDQMTLLRFLGARTACFPLRPISVQLLHDHRKGLVQDMGAYATLCISELKMKMLGRSCAECPGFIPLVAGWFVFNKVQRHKPWRMPYLTRRSREDLASYERGTGYSIYRMEFPECMRGLAFHELVKLLYVNYDVFLLGLISLSNHLFLNPSNCVIGAERPATGGGSFADDPSAVFSGVVLASSLEVVARLSTLKEFGVEPAARRGASSFSVQFQRSDAPQPFAGAVGPALLFGKELSVSKGAGEASLSAGGEAEASVSAGAGNVACSSPASVGGGSARQESGPCWGANGGASSHASSLPLGDVHFSEKLHQLGGIAQVMALAEARATVFSEPKAPLVLVCGWPRALRIFLEALLQRGPRNVVILSPAKPGTVGPADLAAFSHCCAYVSGSALSMTDLSRAGALEACACVVFGTPHVSWKSDMTGLKLDTQALLVRRTILALHRRSGRASAGTAGVSSSSQEAHASQPGSRLLLLAPEASRAHELHRVAFQEGAEDAAASVGRLSTSTAKQTKSCAEASAASSQDGAAAAATAPRTRELEWRSLAGSGLPAVGEETSWRPSSLATTGAAPMHTEGGVTDGLSLGTKTEFASSVPSPPFAAPLPSLPASAHEKREADMQIYLDLKDAALLQYCELFSTESSASTSARESVVRPQWLRSLYFASGFACVEEMFHGMIAHSLPVSRYSVEWGAIDALVTARPQACPRGRQRAFERMPLTLEKVPPMFFGSSFRRLFEHLLTLERKVAIGIYRQLRHTPPIPFHDQPTAIVISCPSRDLRLMTTDQVYVLHQGFEVDRRF